MFTNFNAQIKPIRNKITFSVSFFMCIIFVYVKIILYSIYILICLNIYFNNI